MHTAIEQRLATKETNISSASGGLRRLIWVSVVNVGTFRMKKLRCPSAGMPQEMFYTVLRRKSGIKHATD